MNKTDTYGIIYKATNLITKKCYIGQTTRGLDKRVQRHYEDSVRHTYAFANALRKYKKADWCWEILYNNIPSDKLNLAEMCLIYVYDSYYGGYNSTLGGEDNPMNYAEYRKKVGLSKIGVKRPNFKWRPGTIRKPVTDEFRKRVSEKNSGSGNPMFGKKHSHESVLMMSISSGSRPFDVYKDNVLIGTWINKVECSRFLKIDNSSITKYLKGKSKNSLGYTFVYQS